MPNYTVKSNLRHDGEVYKPGDTIELNTKIADPLVKDGVLADPTKKVEDEVALEPRAPKAKGSKGAKATGKGSKSEKADEDEKPEKTDDVVEGDKDTDESEVEDDEL